MPKRALVVGGTGAVGTPIARRLSQMGCDVEVLNSKNFNLTSEKPELPNKSSCEMLVHSAGTFGGLKQYTENGLPSQQRYLENLTRLINNFSDNGGTLAVNISSATLANKGNSENDSPYYDYFCLKTRIEDIFNSSNINHVINLRPTNIISVAERISASNHVIASVFKKIKAAKSMPVEIWSNELDWREFTDADDLANLVIDLSRPIMTTSFGGTLTRKTIHCSNGERILIRQIVNEINSFIHGQAIKQVIYTQPHRPGPLPEMLQACVRSDGYQKLDTTFATSLRKICEANKH
jgi:nucleoside-diphosphate-sugar epimerase